MLLVDADDAEATHRREDRRTRADDDSRLARSDPLALVPPFRLRQAGVKHRHEIVEARAEAAQRLRRQRDLRDEDDGVAAAGQSRRAGAEVHLGLTAARLAPEQEVANTGRERLLHPPRAASCDGLSTTGASSAASVCDAAGVRRSPRRARAGGATSASARAGVEP